MWPSNLDEWPNTREDFIYDWWMSVSDQIPKTAKLQADHWHIIPDTEFMEIYLKHNFDEPVFQGPKNQKTKKNPSHELAARRAISIGVRRLAPRLLPIVGWGLLAKDIHDFLDD